MATDSRQPRTPPSSAADRRASRLATTGIVALLIGALLALGVAPLAMPDSYSWIEHGTSESAAQGIDGAWIARAGFILYGLAVVGLVIVRARTWGPLASALHGCFGVSMFAVAAFSTRPWQDDAIYVDSEDSLHSLFAGIMGFGFVAGITTLIVLRRHRSARAAAPDWIVFAITLTIPLAMSASIWGVLQRLMFLTAAVWYAREAWTVDAWQPKRTER